MKTCNSSQLEKSGAGMPSIYKSLGVDVEKKGIDALRKVTDDLHPEAFCSIVRHPLAKGRALVLHEDGAGTKPIVSYLAYKETGDPKWFEPLAADVLAMNIDDIVCVGAVPLAFSDYIALNGFTVDKQDLLEGLAAGFSQAFSVLRDTGSQILFSGGETADLPDIVRTFDVSGTVYGEVDLGSVITGSLIEPGDSIVGLRSGGSCRYENYKNSGLMCNGITLARHSLLTPDYAKGHPEASRENGTLEGRYRLDSEPDGLGMTIGEALISPTRIFLPIAAKILRDVPVKAMVHNTGGGLTKCKRLGRGILYVKNNLPEPDPLFNLIQKESSTGWDEMYQDFNMGIGFEVIVEKGDVETVIKAAARFGVGAQIIGHCERSEAGNAVFIESAMGRFRY
jgi:phosphoribosylformylglycinamidine cyclo-ligase